MLRPIYLQPGDKVAFNFTLWRCNKRTAGCGLFTPDLLGVGASTRTTRSFPTREIGRHG